MSTLGVGIGWLLLVCVGVCGAQTSSLYVEPEAARPAGAAAPTAPAYLPNGAPNRLQPSIAEASLVAAPLPEPRRFAVQDLVTIIVRESTEASDEGKLDAKKDAKFDGGVTSFPTFRMQEELLGLFLREGNLGKEKPKVGVTWKNDYKGDGEYSRKDTFTTRITARIIDIKPNGLLVLEARKFIQNDKETLNMTLTGTCRKEDVGVDNTLLSTQIYDLHLVKKHEGEVKKTTDKGVLTKVLDFLFNF